MREPGRPEFDAYRDSYADQISQAISFAGQGQDFFTRAKGERLTELLAAEWARSLPRSGPLRVLDVGCGHGLIHPALLAQTQAAIELSGIDMAGDVIEVARRNNPRVSYQVYDGVRLPYDDASFDFAFAICVMHHVPPAQWVAFLREMKRVVRPGGAVAVFEHNPLNPLTVKVVRSCPIDDDAVLLRAGRLKSLMRAAGLGAPAGRYILFTPFDRPLFQAIDRKLGWLPLGAQYFVLSRA